MAKTGLLGSLGQFNTDPMSVFRGTPGISGGLPGSQEGQALGGMLGTQAGLPGVISENPDLAITGDGWHPHKQTVLGALADMYMMSRGMKPAFAQAREEKNLQEAMAGFTDDPKKAINRMAQIRGHGTDAWKMYDSYTDNSRQQGNLDRQNQIFDMKRDEIVWDRVASMMKAANPQTWSKMRELAVNRYGDAADSLIPQDWDPDSIEYIRQGAVKPKDQERIAQADKRIEQGDKRITETNRHNEATEGQAATNEAGRNNRNATNESGRNTRSAATIAAKPNNPSAGRVVKLKNSGEYGEVRGNKMMVHQSDGKVRRYLQIGPDNWKQIDVVDPKDLKK